MREINLKGIIFGFFSLLFGVSLFLPYIKITASLGNRTETSTTTVMPSLFGFIMLIVAALGVFVLLNGMKTKAALVGAIAAILVMVRAFTDSASAARAGQSMKLLNELSNALFDSNSETVYDWGHTFGFYVMILSGVMMLIFGLLYTLSED